jgi:hypothetical protein
MTASNHAPMTRISSDELALLTIPETVALVERHLGDDPVALALRLKGDRTQARLVCRQIKYLQRAREKLPSYYAARCIVPPLAFEQCSSEAAAAMKDYAGALCIDLTGGLGVDSLHFSRSFDRVIAVERDPVLTQVARHNFSLLDVKNITFENDSAESFLTAYRGPKAGLIYLDPSRRGEGGRVFRLEDCSPNVPVLLPLLLEWGERVVIKLSPLFDPDEAIRLFGPHLASVEALSVGGEVKELLIELTESPEELQVGVRIAGTGRLLFEPQARDERAAGPWTEADHLLVPDAAFYKMRLTDALLKRRYPHTEIFCPEKNGFAFACGIPPEDFPGRIYRIEERMAYRPKRLKKWLAERGVSRVNLLRRGFPFTSEQIKGALGVSEGGTEWLAFTRIAGENAVFRVAPV